MAKLIHRIANQMANDLLGTCNPAPDYQELGDALWMMGKVSNTSVVKKSVKLAKLWDRIESQVTEVINSQMFCCVDCSWWFGLEEMSDSGECNCEDCAND